eukprot:11209954-Lingulodinium_polyedra.AAC.1
MARHSCAPRGRCERNGLMVWEVGGCRVEHCCFASGSRPSWRSHAGMRGASPTAAALRRLA